MNKDVITKNEMANDGQSVYLYYDAMAGVYLAYGWSAYYTTMVINPYLSYSEDVQMPVALLNRDHILYLRQSLKKVEHEVKHYYKFQMSRVVGAAGYERWVQKIIKDHLRK